MKKKIIAMLVIIGTTLSLSACGTWNRFVVDVKSDVANGLDRTINVYTANGDLIAQYTGKIDLEMNDGGYIKFDLNGKRYIYYNCFVESITDIP